MDERFYLKVLKNKDFLHQFSKMRFRKINTTFGNVLLEIKNASTTDELASRICGARKRCVRKIDRKNISFAIEISHECIFV